MFSKSILLGAVFGFVVLFFGGWIFYDMLAANYFAAHSNIAPAKNMNLAFIALGSLLQTYTIAVIYTKYYKEHIGFIASGFQLGILMGFFVGFGIGMLMYGTSKLMNIQAHLVDAVWNVIFYGIVGVAIGWAFKLTSKKVDI